MTEKDLKRVQSAYESGLDVEIWFDGRWYKFDAREHPNGGFSTTRQFRIVGQKYVDEAEKQIKDLQEQITDLEGIVTAQGNALEKEYAINAELKKQNEELQEENRQLANDYEMIHNCFLITENENKKHQEQIAESKGIIREYLEWADWKGSNCPSFASICIKAKVFLKE